MTSSKVSHTRNTCICLVYVLLWYVTCLLITPVHYLLQTWKSSVYYTDKPRDCSEIYKSGERSDGVYTLYVNDTRRPVEVYCDMATDGGGWTVCVDVFQYY